MENLHIVRYILCVMVRFIGELKKDYRDKQNKKILIVTHGGITRRS